jgi:predicted site-specific integrase-resolvase
MTSQIFKKQVPNEILFKLLENICSNKNEKYYILNSISFKKGLYCDSISIFLELCKPFYYNSKKKYLERKITYNMFTTVIRQICNFNNIKYTTQIKYDKSVYDIIYIIYL